ncbi:MAG: hypothetical protein AAFX93_05355 [Verrucomicrobiota bacterium]
MSSLIAQFRLKLLALINDQKAMAQIRRFDPAKMQSYIVVTPHLVHLTPLAVQNAADHVQPVLVDNGLTAADREWLSKRCPHTPFLDLLNSFSSNSETLIQHGVVINHLARGHQGVFCIQDADCFIGRADYWNELSLDLDKEFAVGPFLRKTRDERPTFPETFLLLLNGGLMQKLKREHGITAENSKLPNAKARKILREAGIPDGQVLERNKDYYDTLQQYWVAAKHLGYSYRHIPGEDKDTWHIGGTSYLFKSFDDLAHWDYWPLNVHYLHLRLLEQPSCEPIRPRFQKLFDFHQNADNLLNNYPEFARGWRREMSDLIIGKLTAIKPCR